MFSSLVEETKTLYPAENSHPALWTQQSLKALGIPQWQPPAHRHLQAKCRHLTIESGANHRSVPVSTWLRPVYGVHIKKKIWQQKERRELPEQGWELQVHLVQSTELEAGRAARGEAAQEREVGQKWTWMERGAASRGAGAEARRNAVGHTPTHLSSG